MDAVLGPGYERDETTGRKIDPDDLDQAAADALARGACASAEHELIAGAEVLTGADDDYLPSELNVIRRGSRVSPKMLEELAGFGLLTHAGTVTT